MTSRFVRCLFPLVFAICVCVQTQNYAADTKPAPTPAELVQIAKSNANPIIRQNAIEKLGSLSEADERNLLVTELLVDIAKMGTDPFLGKKAVRACTKLQLNVTKRAKTKYIVDFMALLKNPKAIPGVRSEIADCFRQTLDKDELKDRDAFIALKAIAQSKTETNVNLRAQCIEAIGGFGDADNIVMLCELLSDPDPYIKEAAAHGIVILLDKAPDAGKGVSIAATNKIVEMVNDATLGVDLRVVVIHADALMISANAPGAKGGLETIIKLVKDSDSDRLVMAGIEALGIIGMAQTVDPLIAAYTSYFDQKNMQNEKDMPVRAAVATALQSALTTQAQKPNPDLATVHKIAVLLQSIIDTDTAPSVKEAGVYAIGYLYPAKFVAENKDSAASLIFLMEKKDTSADLKAHIVDSLEAITRVNFGTNVTRWKDWLQKTYPGLKSN